MRETYDTFASKRVLIHAGDDANGRAAMYMDNDSCTISDGSGNNGIAITQDFGTSISGPLSIMSGPDQVRFAGLWKINPVVVTSLPSTVYTPVPWLRQSIPTSATEIVRGLADVMRAIV